MDRSGTYYYHQNGLWSVEAVTDSTGTVAERYDYDAYGAGTTTAGTNSWGTAHSAIGNPWMFTGREFDEETGLYYYRARSYDAFKGRFLQRDPEEYRDAMNLYEYAGDNPVNRLDPSGKVSDPASALLFLAGLVKGLRDSLDSRSFAVRQTAECRLTMLCKKDVTGVVQGVLLMELRSRPSLEAAQRIRRIIFNCRQFNACLGILMDAVLTNKSSPETRKLILGGLVNTNVYDPEQFASLIREVARQYIKQLDSQGPGSFALRQDAAARLEALRVCPWVDQELRNALEAKPPLELLRRIEQILNRQVPSLAVP
jgi:RHS repeat-associated protein